MAYYHRCDRSFKSDPALQQHKDGSGNHWVCDDCNRDFVSREARIQHYRSSPRHHYCDACDEHFGDEDELKDHDEEEHSYCRDCDEFFSDQKEKDEHMDARHWFCKPCRRTFMNENSLRMHLQSSIHRARRVQCPGRGCTKAFVERSHLLLHLESGTCPSGATRHLIDKHVTERDRNHIITNTSRLIQYPDGSYLPRTEPQYWATQRSWNGCAYECVLCHREYGALASLDQHLRSPAHADRIYRCPPAGSGCNAQFVTLSALLQHVETASCGVSRFRARVRDLVDEATAKMRRLAV